MDFEDKDSERPGVAGGDPLPPEDWERVGRSARIEAIYSEHRPQITRFFKTRAPTQDVGDLVQEVFSRFASARGGLAALVRNRFEGAETRLRAGTADGDYGEIQISQMLGKGWSTGHTMWA